MNISLSRHDLGYLISALLLVVATVTAATGLVSGTTSSTISTRATFWPSWAWPMSLSTGAGYALTLAGG
jgi:hypothetical protein